MKTKFLTVFIAIALVCPLLLAQSSAEAQVLQKIQEMMKSSGGRVTFSDLHNDPAFGPEEKAFLGRLYEIFFQLPGFLKSEYESTQQIPTRQQTASSFGISPTSVMLLLRVMEADPRVPPLFERDQATGEITALKLDAIEAFIRNAGAQVRVTQWEGKKVPTFSLPTFEGETLTDKKLLGSNSLLYFWFTGCPPCVRIAPILAELDRKYRSSKFQVVGLNADRLLEIDMTDAGRAAYLKKNGAEYTNVHLDQATREAFGNIHVYPTLFLIGPDGTIEHHFLNFQDKPTLEKVIREMMQKTASGGQGGSN